jgi:DNA-binding GntR family transcriptional regulator
LGTSRIPARDALLALEEQGLLVSTAHGRCVLQPTERDIRELYQVRTSLERLAAQLAARNTSEQHRAELQAELDEMERASVEADTQRFTESDLRFHALMWRQADNNHLIAALTRLIGPMYLFIGFNVTHFSWVDTLELHRDLVRRLSNGDEDGAAENIERHLKLACMKTLEAFDTHHKQPRR